MSKTLFLERQIRSETINDSTELMEQWFQTIEEKNQLLRRENELMIEQRYLQLEVNPEDILIETPPDSNSAWVTITV